MKITAKGGTVNNKYNIFLSFKYFSRKTIAQIKHANIKTSGLNINLNSKAGGKKLTMVNAKNIFLVLNFLSFKNIPKPSKPIRKKK